MAKHHFNVGITGKGRSTRWGHCLGCGRRIFYGDRCPPCAQELRQRKRRKPR